MGFWKYGKLVTMPDFELEGASSILADIMSIFFTTFFLFNFFCCIVHVTQTPRTTNSTRAAQGACYQAAGYKLNTPVARQQSRKQHHAFAVVCPRCIAVASY